MIRHVRSETGDPGNLPRPGIAAVPDPGVGYFEWATIAMPDKPKPLKQPFYITRRDGLPLTFAGLWERWKDGLLSCAILTTEAGNATRRLHRRMPLVLDAPGIDAWLSGDAPELADNIDANLRLYPLSLRAEMPLLEGSGLCPKDAPNNNRYEFGMSLGLMV